jgi:hypothetical protein
MSIINIIANTKKPTRKKIKIAVACDDSGNWVARGGSEYEGNHTIDELLDDEQEHLDGDAKQSYWLVVDIPLPVTEVLAGQSADDE